MALANEILKVLSIHGVSQEEMKQRITELCNNDIYVNTTNSKPAVNRFKFLTSEFKKENRSFCKKIQKSEKYGFAWTNSYILCTFHDTTDFPASMIATEDSEKINVDRVILTSLGNEEANTVIEYKTIKARLSSLPTKKEKDNDSIEISGALFRTRLIEKVFKFYNVTRLEMYVEKNRPAYGFIDNDKDTPFIICSLWKK